MAKIVSIEDGGIEKTYDIWNKESDCLYDQGNFVIDGLVVHNSILANGVKTFEDLLFYNAAGHPGPMASIPEAVSNRDDEKQQWVLKLKNIHPRLYEILKSTYGIILWQEQLQQLWQEFAGFTAPEAQEARKAVAKKWAHKLKPIEGKWVIGASKILGKEVAEEYWGKMVSFGRYAFNRCLSKDTILVDTKTNLSATVEEWCESKNKLYLKSYVDDKIVVDECITIHDNGEQDVYEIEFDNGDKEFVTLNHRFLCEDGQYHTIKEIINCGLEITEAPVAKYDMSPKIDV